MHFEGRSYVGLMRHRVLGLTTLAFVALQTEQLRGKNPEVTLEQVCRALNVRCAGLLRRKRGTGLIQHTAEVIGYHQERNRKARQSRQKQSHRLRC